VSAATGVGGVLRGVAHLSVGTTLVQAMVAVSQILLVVWLSPAEFGVWATATASTAVLTGLVNFGEVNGYLASGEERLREARRTIWRLNGLLGVGAVAVVVGYWMAGQRELAILVALIGLNIPLLGECNLLYAAYVRRRENGSIVRAQVVSGVARTAVGLVVAWLTRSALAFAVATLAYSAVMIVLLAPPTRTWLNRSGDRLTRIGWRARSAWSVQALCQLLPTQVDFLIVALVAGPTLLGLYFFAYQVTVGLSTLVAGPLAKSVLAALAAQDERIRPVLAERLMSVVAAGIGAAAAVAVGTIALAASLLPSDWEAAAPVICILLASVPARFLTALSDAVQMAAGSWWRSAALNAVDAMGTAAVALTAVTGDITALAVSMVAWKTVVMLVRVWRCPLELSPPQRVAVVTPAVLVAGALTVAVLAGRPFLWLLTAGALAVCGTRIAVVWRSGRLAAAPRGVVATESSWS
jgi:O-antigen/teichoic acid export membrane protein